MNEVKYYKHKTENSFAVTPFGVSDEWEEITQEQYEELTKVEAPQETQAEKYDRLVREKMYARYPQDKQDAIFMKALSGDMVEFNEMKAYQDQVKQQVESELV